MKVLLSLSSKLAVAVAVALLLQCCGCVSLATAPLPHSHTEQWRVMQKVFHAELLGAHGLSAVKDVWVSEWESELEGYLRDFSEGVSVGVSEGVSEGVAIPALWCSRGRDEGEGNGVRVSEGVEQKPHTDTITLTPLVVNHTSGEVCYLVHTPRAQWSSLHTTTDASERVSEESEGQREWRVQVQVLPPLLKIHTSVLQFLTTPTPSTATHTHTRTRTDATSTLLNRPNYNKGIDDKNDTPHMEDMDLVVELVPHAGVRSPSHTQSLQGTLREWTARPGSGRGAAYFSQSLEMFSTLLGPRKTTTWSTHRERVSFDQYQYMYRQRHRQQPQPQPQLKPHVQSICELPDSVELDFPPPSIEGDGNPSQRLQIKNVHTMWYIDDEDEEAIQSKMNFCFLSLVEALSLHPDVLSVSVTPRARILNYHARGIIQSGSADDSPFSAAGILGKGQVVGVADTGLDDLSCYFYDTSNNYGTDTTSRDGSVELNRRKVVQYNSFADSSDGVAGHGTHVVGSIVGAALTEEFSFANGVAPGAKVAFFDMQDSSKGYLSAPQNLATSLFSPLYSSGARVFSNSYGGGTYYTSSCYDVDYFSYNNPDSLIIFAAGNSGASGTSTALSPCISKNSLCVGSMDAASDIDDSALDSNRVSYFSSMGPTSDGRIKPDVVSTGFKIVSALSGGGSSRTCGLYESFGTSMATPVVAGGALLLRDYFSNLWSNVCRSSYSSCKSFEPTGYLLKAVIIHSGAPVSTYSDTIFDHKTDIPSYSLSGMTPDFVQGYGAVTLHSVIPLTAQERISHDLFVADKAQISAGGTFALQVTVYDSRKPLKVTVVWFDKPSAANSASNLLILNLDVVVTSSSGTAWYGNGINADTVNPQEQVYIKAPATGTYSILISNTGEYGINAGIVVTCNGHVSQELTQQGSKFESLNTIEDITSPTVTDSKSHGFLREMDDIESGSGEQLEAVSALQSASGSYFSQTLTIANTLPPMSSALLGTVQISSSGYLLSSLDIKLDSTYIIGSEAFIFAIVLYAPNGEIIQIGGYNEYVALDRFWNRMAPVHYTQLTSPVDGSLYYSYTRNIAGLGLAQVGEYKVYAELLHSTWTTTTFHGSVTLNFNVHTSAPTRQPTPVPSPRISRHPTVEPEPGTLLNEIESEDGTTIIVGVFLFCGFLVMTFLVLKLNRVQRSYSPCVGLDNSGSDEAMVLSPLQTASASVTHNDVRPASGQAVHGTPTTVHDTASVVYAKSDGSSVRGIEV